MRIAKACGEKYPLQNAGGLNHAEFWSVFRHECHANGSVAFVYEIYTTTLDFDHTLSPSKGQVQAGL